MMNNHYRFVVAAKSSFAPSSQRLLHDAHVLGFPEIKSIISQDLYFIQGNLTFTEQQQILRDLLCDPVVQEGLLSQQQNTVDQQIIEVVLHPGVTDPVAEELVKRAHQLGLHGVKQAATGKRYLIESSTALNSEAQHLLAKRLLANPVIHHYALGAVEALFVPTSAQSPAVEHISLSQLDEAQLLKISRERRLALDLAEMQAIQAYYKEINRPASDVELEMIAQTWSEHCSHKTFRATIKHGNETISGLLKSYIKKATDVINAPWVASAFVDNAGIIDFDDEYQVSFKVETHNHPSAIEPFGGANTGLGGVIRDILGVSAKPIAATDVFCFGPEDLPIEQLPSGSLHPRLIRTGVVAGVEDYGNKTGIPTVNGAIYYDVNYSANPLVFCGCIGLIPKNTHPRQPQPGDHIILLGGHTGRDGLRGATFSSMTMDAQTGEVAGASVQIGDPIIAKGLIEVVTRARDQRLYHAITDCGAGGLSSAVGEMASSIGAEIELKKVPLKYPGLAPWEIWLSEAQERMVLAVPSQNIDQLKNICAEFDIDITDLGQFVGNGKLVVRHNGNIVLELRNQFLFEDMPKKQLISVLPKKNMVIQQSIPAEKAEKYLLDLLRNPNIASKADVIRCYDHEIQGGTIIKPLLGVKHDAPSDACVLKPQGTKGLKGIVISNGLNPEIGKSDAYLMAISAIDEAIRNAVAVGADPDRIAILDNFCWGDPTRPETLGELVEAARGCHDAALHYKTPFISGKDSLNNEYVGADGKRHAIPGTLLISALGIIEDITCAVSMDFKAANNLIYLISKPESCMPMAAPKIYRDLHQAMQKKLIRACHDVSEGGVALALAEMCIGGRLGCDVSVALDILFAEGNGCLIVEIESDKQQEFLNQFKTEIHSMLVKIGEVTQQQNLLIKNNNQVIITLPIEQLAKIFNRK